MSERRPHGARYGEGAFDVVAFDADDTLWHSEDEFVDVEARFVELVAPHTPEGVDLADALRATELENLLTLGYGVKSFALSMIECAVTASGGKVPASVIGDLVAVAHQMLTDPVRLLDGVPEALGAIAGDHRLVVITKGDLIHQQRKMSTSGLAHHFEHVEIVSEKDPGTYRHVADLLGVEPARFCMVGNSVRSDVLPVVEIGGHAVHIPYTYTWSHEVVDGDDDHEFAELDSIADLPAYLASADAEARGSDGTGSADEDTSGDGESAG